MKIVIKKELPQVVIDVGKRIEAIIKQKNLKRRDIAYDANLDVENLRKYIRGRQEMKISTLVKIASALKVDVGDLFKKGKLGKETKSYFFILGIGIPIFTFPIYIRTYKTTKSK